MDHAIAPDGPLPELKHPAPEWFRWAIDKPATSHRVEVQGGHTHYLKWSAAEGPHKPGILFLYGGGAHANWWRPIAPFFAFDRDVAAMDHAVMGDSSHRAEYDAGLRVAEIRVTIRDSGHSGKPIVVGHSFGNEVGAAVIVDSSVRPPHSKNVGPIRRPCGSMPTTKRRSPGSACGLARRFRTASYSSISLATQCAPTKGGWTWKFDPEAVGPKRFREPFAEHLDNMT